MIFYNQSISFILRKYPNKARRSGTTDKSFFDNEIHGTVHDINEPLVVLVKEKVKEMSLCL